jgi:2-succinyl-6-hydroxy-2,4-cyclohexadiene-1-carboxylate synthase
VLLHGFTQTARLWGPFGDRLADDHTLLAVDLPGHGGSGGVRADLPETAALVHQAVEATIGTEPCDVLGYSLGARVALHLVLGTGLAVRRLVTIGATGGIEDEEVRAQRRASDEALADALEASGDVGAFIDNWVGGPLFARLGAAAEVDERRRNNATGLAGSLRLAGTGTQEPLWDRLPLLTVPALALAGTDDTRFAGHALRIARLVTNGVASLVPGGGHAVHLAQPLVSWRLVGHWLAGPYQEETHGQQESGDQLQP